MDNWAACEASFRNGYEKGYEQGKKDAMINLLNEYADALMETVENLRELSRNLKGE